VWHDSCVTWLMCDMTRVWHDSCVTWLMCDMTHVWHDSCVTWLMCDMTHVWHDSCVTWFVGDTTRYRQSFLRATAPSHVTRKQESMHAQRHVWHDSCITWFATDMYSYAQRHRVMSRAKKSHSDSIESLAVTLAVLFTRHMTRCDSRCATRVTAAPQLQQSQGAQGVLCPYAAQRHRVMSRANKSLCMRRAPCVMPHVEMSRGTHEHASRRRIATGVENMSCAVSVYAHRYASCHT